MDLTVETLSRATSVAGSSIDELTPEDLDKPTPPCTDWEVHDLLNHLIGGNVLTTARLNRRELPSLDTDFVGNDPAGAYDDSVSELAEAFQRPNVMEETFEHSAFGQQNGAFFLRLRIFEALAHGWDLAAALQQPRDREPDLYEEAYRMALVMMENRPPATNAAFAPPQSVASDAPPADRYAALLGRTIPTEC